MGFYIFSLSLLVVVRLKLFVIVVCGEIWIGTVPILPTTGLKMILLPELLSPLLFLYIILSISFVFTFV